MSSTHNERLLDRRKVIELTSLSSATLHRQIAAEKFPRPIKISANRVAWPASVVDAWINEKMGVA